MPGRRAAVIVTIMLSAAGGGAALAATHGGSSHPAKHAAKRPGLPMKRTAPALVRVHVCHPGRKGSMLDSLQ
jgi:hypothetical protein